MKLSTAQKRQLLTIAETAARQAGAAIESFPRHSIKASHKEAGSTPASSVVTQVDHLAQSIILEHLQPTCESFDLGLLTEEHPDDGSRLIKDYFWSIDPLDGTLPYVEAVSGYGVAIALVERSGVPVIGVIYAPDTQTLYSCLAGEGVQRQGASWQPPSPSSDTATIVMDRSLLTTRDGRGLFERVHQWFTAQGKQITTLKTGAASMNAMWVLENPSACYFKLPKAQQGGGSVWDFAPSTGIFNELGLPAHDIWAQPLQLNRRDTTYMNHSGVVFASDPELAQAICQLAKQIADPRP